MEGVFKEAFGKECITNLPPQDLVNIWIEGADEIKVNLTPPSHESAVDHSTEQPVDGWCK